MLPLILGVVGGYLIGDSMKEAIFEDGGTIDDAEDDNIDYRKIVLKALSKGFDKSDVEKKYLELSSGHYISFCSTKIPHSQGLLNVKFSYLEDFNTYEGGSEYKLTVDGDDVDLDLFTEKEQVEIEGVFDYLKEMLREYLD
jgi:hypothetical protein